MIRFNTHDKTTRAKLKIFESKIKEMRDSSHAKGSIATQNSSNEDKYKSKILSLERSNEVLKQRTTELTKRLTQEQEGNNELQQKITKLKQKISQLERSLKDSQASKLSSSHKGDESQSGLTSQQDQPEESKLLSTLERPLDLADLRVESKENQANAGQANEKRSPKKSPVKSGGAEETGIRAVLRDTNQKNVVQNLSKTKFSQDKIAQEVVDSKKVTGQTVVNKPTAIGGYEEIRVLLSALEAVIDCVKTNKLFRSQLSPRKTKLNIDEEEFPIAELGQLLGTKAQILLPAFAELSHLITKPNSSKETHIILEIFHALLNYSFKNNLEQESLQLTSTKRENILGSGSKKDKTLQDISVSHNRSLSDHDMSAQTEYWKRYARNNKISPHAILGHKPSANFRESCLQLFPDSETQKEIIRIISSCITASEVVIKSPNTSKVEKDFENVESIEESSDGIKFLYMQRLLGYLSIIFLTKNKKEFMSSIQGLIKDLTAENYIIAEFLKRYFVRNDGVSLLFWLLRESAEDQVLMNSLADLLLILGSNGKHYLPFINQISTHSNIKVKNFSGCNIKTCFNY